MTPLRPLGLIGNLNVDLMLGPVSQLPAWDQEVLAEHMEVRFAGTVGYIALAAQALEMPSVILSTVGDDLYGRYLREELAKLDLPADGVTTIAGEPTPLTAVTVGTGGPRALVTVLGAHKQLDLAYYRAHRHLLANCAEIFICGSYLLPGLDCRAARVIAEDARAHGQLVCFDPSWDPTNWSPPVREATLALLPLVDIFLPNAAEIEAMMKVADWRTAAEQVAALGPEVVVKRGRQGAAALVGGTWFEAEPYPVECRDTTGAGDTFDAAYLWARRQGWQPQERLRFANAVAALVVSHERRVRYPAVEEAMQLIQAHGSTEASGVKSDP